MVALSMIRWPCSSMMAVRKLRMMSNAKYTSVKTSTHLPTHAARFVELLAQRGAAGCCT